MPGWFIVPTLLVTAFAAVLCFVPLFNILGYEFSLAITLLAAPCSIFVGFAVARRQHGLRGAGWAGLLSALTLVGAFALILLNALRVQNCNLRDGLVFFLGLPLMSSVYGGLLGHLAGQLLAAKKRRWRLSAGVGLAVLPLAASLWHLYAHPPIFAYNHLYGHFAGSLYDEAISLGTPFWAFRAGTLLRIAGFFALAAFWRQRLLSPRRPGYLMWTAMLLVAATVYIYDTAAGRAFGFRVYREDIMAALPQTVARPGLMIHLPEGTSPELAERIADDHAFRLHQLEQRLELQIDRNQPIRSFVYRNPDHKARWMGGRGTMVAKPWQREIHIHGLEAPHPVMGHELAHIVAGNFGSRFLSVSARLGVFVNMAIVEGFAEAMSPPEGAMDLDTWAKALHQLGLAPDVRKIIGPAGFWSAAPRRAYTVAGSFIQFLERAHGVEKLKAVYASGDFRGIYGVPLEALVDQWEQYLDSVFLSDKERRQAEERFRTPSIFSRTCAHEVANLRSSAQKARPEEAVAIYETIAAHLAQAPLARAEVALARARAKQNAGFLHMADELLLSDKLHAAKRAQLLEYKGNIHWRSGELEAAKQAFASVQELQTAAASERLQWVRLWALDQPPEAQAFLRQFLQQDVPPVAAVLKLQALANQHPDDRTYPYLLARQLYNAGAYEDAAAWLARSADHPFLPIEAERLHLLGASSWHLGQLEAAKTYYEAYAESAVESGERMRALDWLERIRWQRQQAPRGLQLHEQSADH